ncbi:septum formation initiator family protein [Sphingorhabdus pulchriflava]|mgnify:FL=1|jgi:cell division protein FtsB|uniref:Septum formation initiator family protein n=1 Tax=Sphingorhabdus pulchriflava TaxID=2292257 RepID=A0A371BGX2_9SPHN|nr:septum formation initiator family protein [Sphingorhabdus pulchriflava]MBK7162612.1 septum formation initiator family protein [Sphingomonadales bacterium]RDV06810.1 septum formation initiator family protein [Sphingorhabdus pulchriflava]
MAKAKRKTNPEEFKAKLVTAAALVALLLIASYALLGPTGIIAWADYKQSLNERSKELAKLEKERDALRNRQRLLDRDNVDPDLAGELMRKELNVVAPDEIVIPLKDNE